MGRAQRGEVGLPSLWAPHLYRSAQVPDLDHVRRSGPDFGAGVGFGGYGTTRASVSKRVLEDVFGRSFARPPPRLSGPPGAPRGTKASLHRRWNCGASPAIVVATRGGGGKLLRALQGRLPRSGSWPEFDRSAPRCRTRTGSSKPQSGWRPPRLATDWSNPELKISSKTGRSSPICSTPEQMVEPTPQAGPNIGRTSFE